MRRRRAAGRAGSFPIGLLLALALGLLFTPIRLLAQSPPDSAASLERIPPAVGFVNDLAGILDETSRAKLEAFLDQVKRKTGVEFAVLTVTSAPEPPELFKTRVFREWKIGREGLLMLVVMDQRRIVFETGYEIEGVLPDGLQSRIVREQMVDRFRAGDYAGGVVAGVKACAQRIAAEKGVTLEWDGRELRYSSGRRGGSIPLLLVVLLILIAAAMGGGMSSGGRRRRRGGWWSSGGMGGFGGWGGGFGGGGGGGGGFGGGSFGGFSGGSGGGYSSGGGGGGGNW